MPPNIELIPPRAHPYFETVLRILYKFSRWLVSQFGSEVSGLDPSPTPRSEVLSNKLAKYCFKFSRNSKKTRKPIAGRDPVPAIAAGCLKEALTTRFGPIPGVATCCAIGPPLMPPPRPTKFRTFCCCCGVCRTALICCPRGEMTYPREDEARKIMLIIARSLFSRFDAAGNLPLLNGVIPCACGCGLD